jgi:hypothetical protein
MYRFWGYLDVVSHKLHFPKIIRLYICDKFEETLGIDYDDTFN